jgi:hypothetical protein
VELLNAKMKQYLAVGITAVGDAMVTAKAAELYRRADAQGNLLFTVQQLHAGDHFFAMQDLRRSDIVDRIKEPSSDMLRGGTMKIFVDRAYPGPAIDRIHHGYCTHVGAAFYAKNEIHELAARASELGINTAIHGMGNCAVDTVLDAYEAVRRRKKSDSVLRLEHAFVADPRQGARMAEVGVDLVANPGLAYHWGEFFDMWRGEDQHHLRVLPVRSMIDAGVRVSLASDHPCGTFSPAEIIWTAVARTTLRGAPVEPGEAITAAEALRLYTINAAHASNRADREGSIEVGKRANLVVLDRDIVTCPTDDIRQAQVNMTYVDIPRAHVDGAQRWFDRRPSGATRRPGSSRVRGRRTSAGRPSSRELAPVVVAPRLHGRRGRRMSRFPQASKAREARHVARPLYLDVGLRQSRATPHRGRERWRHAGEVVLSRCGRWVVAAGSGLLKAWFEIVVDAVSIGPLIVSPSDSSASPTRAGTMTAYARRRSRVWPGMSEELAPPSCF